jgi:glycosyltransferase involved in cell wall biosynthesis
MSSSSGINTQADASQPRCVAVDLTLLQTGGENGGSWVMTAALIKQLSQLLPHWWFILLTADVGHAEAAQLEGPNVRRECVQHAPPAIRTGALAGLPIARALLARLQVSRPGRIAPTNDLSKPGVEGTAEHADLLRRLGADLLFCPFGQFRMPQFQDPRIPTVSVIYDLQFLDYPEFFSAADVDSRRKAYGETCQLSDALVCISEATRRAVLESPAAPRGAATTIYIRTAACGTGTDATRTQQTLKRLGLQMDRYFVYPANLWLHKNHENLLLAVKKLVRRHPEWDFKVVCTGAGLDRLDGLRSRATSLGLEGRVVFTGYVPRAQVDELLLNCRGMVYPSLYEGFGIPLLEAMRTEKPVACSNVTSLPEVGGNAVLTFDPTRPGEIADALYRLSTDQVLLAQLVEAGRRRASEFGDCERMAREYLDVFLSAIANGPFTSSIHGIYSDRWTSDRVVVVLGSRHAVSEVELKFSLPDWAPTGAVNIVQTTSYSLNASNTRLTAGNSAQIRIHVEPSAGWIELRLSPMFRPSASGLNSDARLLSVMCDSARVLTDGTLTELAEAALA